MAKHLLLIEDDPALQNLFEKFLKYKEVEYTIAETLRAAEAAFEVGPIDAVLADVEIQDGDSLPIIQYCEANGIPCVAFSSNDLNRNNAMNSGAITFVAKPIMMDKLEYMLDKVGIS
ncbi:MAG: response regulator [Chloroflexota bacterium]